MDSDHGTGNISPKIKVEKQVCILGYKVYSVYITLRTAYRTILGARVSTTLRNNKCLYIRNIVNIYFSYCCSAKRFPDEENFLAKDSNTSRSVESCLMVPCYAQ